jgi:hypothetical protein
MNDIIKQIKNGYLTRDNDERYQGGLWDYAGEIVLILNNADPCYESLQSEIYYALWELADQLNKVKE